MARSKHEAGAVKRGLDLRTTRSRRTSGVRGTAILEFALIAPLFALFLFGIIAFGLILGFKQNVTQAANEGARAGAVVLPKATDTFPGAYERRVEMAAEFATNQALKSFGHGCNDDGMTCDFIIDECEGDSGPQCMRVKVSYDYDRFPFLPNLLLLDAFFPNTISNEATAQINPGFSFPDPDGGSGGGDGTDADCNQLHDEGCEPLCDDIPDNGVPDCLADPTVECNAIASDGTPDCSPTQTCDRTAGNDVPDCPQDPTTGEDCNGIADDGVAACPPTDCDLVGGNGVPDCLQSPSGEECNGIADDGVPECPPDACDLIAGNGVADCTAAETDPCNEIGDDGVGICPV